MLGGYGFGSMLGSLAQFYVGMSAVGLVAASVGMVSLGAGFVMWRRVVKKEKCK